MKDFQAKRRPRQWLYSPVVLLLLLVLVVLGIRSVWLLYQKNQVTRTKVVASATALAELAARRQTLDKEIKTLETPNGVEAELRNKFGVIKPGEGIIAIVDDPTVAATITSSSTVESFFLKWRDKLFKH